MSSKQERLEALSRANHAMGELFHKLADNVAVSDSELKRILEQFAGAVEAAKDDYPKVISDWLDDYEEPTTPSTPPVTEVPGPSVPPGPVTPPVTEPVPEPTNPQVDTPTEFYAYRGTAGQVVKQIRDSNYAEVSKEDCDALDNVLASNPKALWYNGNDDELANIEAHLKLAKEANKYIMIVMYNVKDRDGGHYSAGGADSIDAYKVSVGKIDALVRRLQVAHLVWLIVEPDALVQPNTLTDERIKALNYAMRIFTHMGAYFVGLDVGHANWRSVEDTVARMDRLVWPESTETTTVGFVINTSSAQGLDISHEFGDRVSNSFEGRSYVIDTSKCGNNKRESEWCNVWGLTAGPLSTTKTKSAKCKAYLWIKPVGESDGTCNGGPQAGHWFMWYAVDFAKNTLKRWAGK